MEKRDIIFVFIHGTDAKEAKWPRDDNEPLRRILREELNDINVQYDRKCWSGDNSHRERIRAGKDLAEYLIKKYEENKTPLYLVGHSHGGSVISYALAEIGDKIKSLSGVINLATPHIHVEPKEVETNFQILAIAASIVSVLVFIPTIFMIMLTFQGDELTDLQAKIFMVGSFMIAGLSYLLIRYSLKNWMMKRFSADETAMSLSTIHLFRRNQIPVLDVRVESDFVVTKILHLVTKGGRWCQSIWSTISDKWMNFVFSLALFFAMLFTVGLSLLDNVPWIEQILDTDLKYASMAIGGSAIVGAKPGSDHSFL